MKNIIVSAFVSILCCFQMIAQNSDSNKADKLFSRYEFIDAAKEYNNLIINGKGDTYIYGQLAACYYNVYNTIEAERWYARAVSASTNDSEIVYKYAQMLKANQKYEESNTWMKKFASMEPKDDRAIAFKNNPDYLPKLLSKTAKFEIENLEINSEFSDFGGVLKNGQLYFASSRNSVRKNYGWNEQPYLDIYTATISDDGTPIAPSLLNNKINTIYHEGLTTFSPDGNMMYFSRESFYDNIFIKDSESKNKLGVLNLYSSTLLSDGWSVATPLSLNSKNHSVKNPSISSDGKTLYFASDMQGGYGEFDLYKAEIKENGTVGIAINLGDKVNTAGQEMFPFISDNNTLYFSSDGHLGLGGLDVFFTKEIDGDLAPIRNIGSPINSNADDFAFTINENTELGYVSSNRSGGKGSDDIYATKKLQPICNVVVSVRVIDAKTSDPIFDASVGVYDMEGNLLETKSTDNNGNTEFTIPCDMDGQLKVLIQDYESGNFDIKGTQELAIEATISLSPIDKIIQDDIIALNPIYFEYNASNITAQSAFELDKLVLVMNKYPEMSISVLAHTDNIGSASFNERLSNRRAQTTVQYVVSKGIEASRIEGEGKGESEPKIDCKENCSDSDNELNRRSEFIITKGNPNAN